MSKESILKKVVNTSTPRRKNFIFFLSFWFICSVTYSYLGVLVVGYNKNIHDVISKPFFELEFVFILLIIASSFMNAIYYSVPRTFFNKRLLAFFVFSFLLWIFVSLIGFETRSASYYDIIPKLGFQCSKNILFFGFIPGLILSFLMKRQYPTKVYLVGFFCCCLGAMIGVITNHFSCSTHQFSHVLAFHFIPVFMASIFGYFVISRFIRW